MNYKMNIPVQHTTSFRPAHVVQTDPEAETVKRKKCSDSRNISPRSGRSIRNKSPKPQMFSCQRLDKDYVVKRARSITPPNTMSDFQRSKRKLSPSMVPVSPKTKWQMSPGLLGTPTLPIGASQTPDYLKSRVFAEYFEMIDDLVLIADRWLCVIANNFNNNVEARTIKPASSYFDQSMLRQKSARISLEAYFKPPLNLEQTWMQCSDQTLSSLNVIFEAFNYRHTRISDCSNFLKNLRFSSQTPNPNILDQLEQTFFQQQRQVRHKGKSSGADKLWSVSSGPVSKGLTGLFSCKYGISEVLFLIKEYLRVIEAKTLRLSYHKSETTCGEHKHKGICVNYFLQGNVQLKIRLVSVDGTYYILLMAENVSEKVELVEVNSKLNYSYMLMKSLSHELKTPVHQVMQVLKELELLLEVRAASDPQLLKSVQKFEQPSEPNNILCCVTFRVTGFGNGLIDHMQPPQSQYLYTTHE